MERSRVALGGSRAFAQGKLSEWERVELLPGEMLKSAAIKKSSSGSVIFRFAGLLEARRSERASERAQQSEAPEARQQPENSVIG